MKHGQAEGFHNEGTNSLIQDKESEKPITTTQHVKKENIRYKWNNYKNEYNYNDR
jgi:hypothetical protein